MKQQEVPVYLFTGFLDAGKTTFIQETLESPDFNSGEKTLLLVCEEGETEYDPAQFSAAAVYLETLDDAEACNEADLAALLKKHGCTRVIVEYNGMWMIDNLFQNMPENWIIYQEFCFVDTRSFLNYNANMRGLVVDKLKSCELVVFNRCAPETDRMELHKIVRGVNRGADIAYEDPSGQVEYDDIVDPLPYDLNASLIEISDDDYAIFYRDLAEETAKYKGKKVRFLGCVEKRTKLPPQAFVAGRRVMTCCVEDIQFAGLICLSERTAELKNRAWYRFTAKIGLNQTADGQPLPVLKVLAATAEPAPENDVATFY